MGRVGNLAILPYRGSRCGGTKRTSSSRSSSVTTVGYAAGDGDTIAGVRLLTRLHSRPVEAHARPFGFSVVTTLAVNTGSITHGEVAANTGKPEGSSLTLDAPFGICRAPFSIERHHVFHRDVAGHIMRWPDDEPAAPADFVHQPAGLVAHLLRACRAAGGSARSCRRRSARRRPYCRFIS